MPQPLLQTKLYIPSLRPELVRRTRLTNQLRRNRHTKLTLIAAPAGFGKTTLASCWITQQNKRPAWVSLDERDNDLICFFSYIITALHQVAPDIGREATELLQSSSPPPYSHLLTCLINDLAQSKTDLILILDDYHLIYNQTIHNAITFLLENLPPQLQMVIISRAEPPLPLAKLRAKNQLVEVSANDLRFTWAETEMFLNQTLKLGLSGEQITQLETKTEGWITGLQLAALSLKNTANIDRLVKTLAGDNRYVADYLIDEVLSQQPREIQQFLLKTSILEQMNADLCNTVLGISNSQAILETLEKSNLFIIPLDNNRRWYRYHHLFAEILQTSLQRQKQDQIASLHRAAAAWFLDHQMLHNSVEHSLAARDYEQVVACLDSIIDEILAEGKFKTYLNWLDRIPEAYLTPSIILYQLFLLHEMGEFRTFQQKFALVERLLGPLPDDITTLDKKAARHHGILATIKGVLKASNFAIDEAQAHFSLALRLLPPELTFWRVLSLGANGFCHRISGNFAEAITVFSQVVKLALNSELTFISFMYTVALTRLYFEHGKLQEAIDTCQMLLALDEKHSHNIPFAGLAYVVMGELLYQSNELTAAQTMIEQGLDRVIKDGDAYSMVNGYFTLARIYLARGDKNQALNTIETMSNTATDLAPTSQSVQQIVRACQAYIWIKTNELPPAIVWATAPGDVYLEEKQYPDLRSLRHLGIYRTVQEPLKNFADFIKLTLARLSLATGDNQKALAIVQSLLESVNQKNRVSFTTHILILKSCILQELGQQNVAIETLISAVDLVAGEPFFQSFIDEGPCLRALLEKAQKQLTIAEYRPESVSTPLQISQFIDQVLARMPSTPDATQSKELPFDLTPREIDVLNCLARGQTYSEAAECLFVSINTFKTHIKRIYSKLGVTNRTQAVNKAHDLNLLDSFPTH